jgi:hypothetical protein
MFLGPNAALGNPGRLAAAGGGHDHSHGGGSCKCLEHGPAPLTQTMDEMDFDRGLWGLITKDATVAECRAFLEERGAGKWANARDKSGYTPLLYASRRGDVELCRLLLDHGADPNAATPSLRMTPLHRAASTGNAAVVALLLAHGARADALDTAGNSALQAARAGGHDAVVKLLASHAAVPRDGG